MQNMEGMDTDQLIDVPDTPDRLAACQINGSSIVSSSVVNNTKNGGLRDLAIRNGLRGNHRQGGNRKSRILFHHHPGDRENHGKSKKIGSFIGSASDNVPMSGINNPENKQLFRRIRLADQSSKKVNSEPVLDLNKPPLHIPSSSQGYCAHLIDRAKLGSSSDITEIAAANVIIQGENRGKAIDLSEKIPLKTYCSTRQRDTRTVLKGNGGSSTGQQLYTEIPPRFFTCQDESNVLEVNTGHAFNGKLEKGIRSALPVGSIGETRNKTLAADVFNIEKFSKTSSSVSKGDIDGTYDGVGTSMKNVDANTRWKDNNNDKGIYLCSDSQPRTQQSVSRSLQPVTSSRNAGQRRLVRNGCISPENIARAKNASESYFQDNTNDKPDGAGKMENSNTSDGIPSCQIHIMSPCSASNQMHKMKGKGIMNDTMLANAHDAENGSSSCRILVTPAEETNVNGDTDGVISRSVEEIGGWRSTRYRSKKPALLSSRDGGLCKRSDDIHHSFDGRHENRMEDTDYATGVNDSSEIHFLEVRGPVTSHNRHDPCLVQTPSSIVTESDPKSGRRRGAQKMMKRPRKCPSTRVHLGESSSSSFDGSDVSYLRSSGPNIKSSRTHNSQRHPILGPVIELDELGSPEIGHYNTRDGHSIVNEHSSERARQVEADEVLARQLQEQFYHEQPVVVGGAEIDASIAWTLQQEEDAQRASSIGSRDLSRPRDSSIAHLYRQYSPRSFQNSSVRSTNRARVPTSSRMAQLRRGFRGRSPMTSSAEMSFQFPPNMDFETRIHILEALEADVGNNNDMAMTDRYFQMQLDFNENDYEMLLALDENNHEHGGASLNQINGLPQSTVQTENFEEPCAVCLEVPSTGDTIRHLPCLHKFHKECIDPWLRRKRSCPICKSNITGSA